MAKETKKTMLPKSTLLLRFIAGLYLIYLAYELFTGFNVENGAPVWLVITAAIAFAICGLVLAFISGKAFLKGNYEGGSLDLPRQEEADKKEEKK